jgi:hypothetical protein
VTTLVKEEKNVGYDGVFQITHYIYDKEGETDRGCKVSYFNKLKKQVKETFFLYPPLVKKQISSGIIVT